MFRGIYGDAYITGVKTAADSAGQPIATTASQAARHAATIDWSEWAPGDPQAALKVADGGLTDLLNQAGQTIDGIRGTTETRLGNIIADGLANGDSTASIASAMSDLISNPDRAQIIADTEANRAQTAGQADQLGALGYSQFEWMAYDGACEECQGQEDSNPHDLGDGMPPGHPSCRCSIVGSGDLASEGDTTSDTIGPAIDGGEDVATVASDGEPAPSPESDDAAAVYSTKAAAKRDLETIRSSIVEEVQRTSDVAFNNLEAFDGVLSSPVRDDPSWDWYWQLAKGERDRIRRNWVDPERGLGPDQLARIVADKGLTSDGYVDTGMKFFLDNTRTYDAARPILSQGRMVTGNQQLSAYGGFDINSLAPNSAYKVTDMFGNKADALNHLMSLRQEDHTLEEAHRVLNALRTPPGMDKTAYEMTSDEYFAKVFDLSIEMDRINALQASSTDEWGVILSPEDRLIEQQYDALYPPEIRTIVDGDVDYAYDAIMQIAKMTGAIQ